MNLKKLESQLGVSFRDERLLKEALTHRSYLNEHPLWWVSHNERLEYLGDAVLELAVTEHLFTTFPDYAEGQLTSLRAALVNYQMLARVAQSLSLDKYLLLSRGESRDNGRAREVITANAVEAVIGALYLDRGYEAVREFVRATIIPHLPEIIEKGLYRDPKSYLQELIQESLKLTPNYRVMGESGPDHRKQFRVGVYFGERLAAEGEGLSKQDAEVDAARRAIESYEK